MRAVDRFGRLVAGDHAVPSPEVYEPFDEKVARMRLNDELDELDYTDLVLSGEAA